jgi:hypothetical protein
MRKERETPSAMTYVYHGVLPCDRAPSDNRHVPFEIKNAIAAEQTRILTADLYKRTLLKEGILLKQINAKLDAAYNLARANMFKTKTPKFKALLVEWKRIYEDLPDDTGGAGKPED